MKTYSKWEYHKALPILPGSIRLYKEGLGRFKTLEDRGFDLRNNFKIRESAPIILLIPGLFRDDRVLRILGEALGKQGYDVRYSGIKEKEWSESWGLSGMRYKIRTRIHELTPSGKEIYIVGISIGGILGLLEGAVAEKVSHIVQIASPNHGTPFFDHHKNIPRLPIIIDLKSLDLPVVGGGKNVTSFIAEKDWMVPLSSQNPQSNSHDNTLPNYQTISINTNHQGAITDEKIIKQIVEEIQNLPRMHY